MNEQQKKEIEKTIEQHELTVDWITHLTEEYDLRELKFIHAALSYANGYKPGLPGHNLLLIMAKLAQEVGYNLYLLEKAIHNQ